MKQIFFFSLFLIVGLFAFKTKTLKGTYKYAGSLFNGKYEDNSQEYNLQRVYDNKHFDAFVLENNHEPFKYQSGDYKLQADTCLETETFNPQSAVLTGKTIRYNFSFHQDTLILQGNLPNGKHIEEHWVRIKEGK